MLYPRLRLAWSGTSMVSCADCETSAARDSVPSAGAYPPAPAVFSWLWYGVFRVSARLWQTMHATPLLPESVLRNCDSRVAKERPVPLSEVGLKFTSAGARSR